MLWFAVAYGASEVVCVSAEERGAVDEVHRQLDWVHTQRLRIAHRARLDLAAAPLLEWIGPSLDAPDETGVHARASHHEIDGENWLVVEARARRRNPVVGTHVVVAIDTSRSMESVFTRRLPVLQDELEAPYRPVRRIDLARTAVKDLLERLPPDSELSIIAFDGMRADLVANHADAGAVEKVGERRVTSFPYEDGDFSGLVQSRLDPCADHRLVVLTDHPEQFPLEHTVASLSERFPTLETWTLHVGPEERVEAPILPVGARSDAIRAWDHLLDPGGVVASGVSLRIGGHDVWTPGSLVSGGRHLFVIPLPEGVDPHAPGTLDVDGHSTTLVLEHGAPWARAAGAAAAWATRRDEAPQAFPAGLVGAELRAWVRHEPLEETAMEPR